MPRTFPMLGPLQEKKAAHYFKLIDEDGNGLIEVSDFALRAQRLAMARDLSDDEEHEALRRQVVAWWEHLCQIADYDGDARVTLSEWKAYWETIQRGASEGERETLRTLENAARGTMRAIDRDETGRITEPEYADWLEAWGAEGSEEAFERLDRTGKGYLTEDDFVDAVREFYLSNDPEAPGNVLYGPLST